MNQPASAPRKPDRRAVYTQKVIKDAMLELLAQMPYEKITVAALCRQAEITRATFYLHYLSLDSVLNELLEEAVYIADKVCAKMSFEERMQHLGELSRWGSAQDLKERECLLAPCQRIADDPRYRVLFQDPALSHYVIHRLYQSEKESMTRYLVRQCGLPADQAENLFMMIVYGLFYCNRALQWKKDDNWYEMQFVANQFIFGGLKSVAEGKENRAKAQEKP